LNTLAENVKKIPEIGNDVYNAVWPKVVSNICSAPKGVAAMVSLGWKGATIDRKNTFLQLTIPGHTFKLSAEELPVCPPGGISGDKCSENADCYSDDADSNYFGYTQGSGQSSHSGRPGGYCLNDQRFKTSTFCLGRCIKLRPAGESCSGSKLNLPVNFAHSAENEVCESGVCLCDTCTDLSGKVRNAGTCATNDNCASGWCEKPSGTIGCTGKCRPKRADGVACYNSDGLSCRAGQCTCGVCGSKLPNESRCATNDNCASGWCEKPSWTVGCGGKCKPKRQNGVACYNSDGLSCYDGQCTCGKCGRKQARGRSCATDDNCQSGSCSGWFTIGCRGDCN